MVHTHKNQSNQYRKHTSRNKKINTTNDLNDRISNNKTTIDI